MEGETFALHTDLYELSMALAYAKSGKAGESAAFELRLRGLPKNRNYLVVTGVSEALQYLQNLRFTDGQISLLKKFPQFSGFSDADFDCLRNFKFTGEVWSVPDGTILFANEPILFVRAPRIEAQLAETFLLGTIRSHTEFSSKASRACDISAPAEVIEFGSRHIEPSLALVCAAEAYAAGCAGTSNVKAAECGVPAGAIKGTMAHSFVMSFASEIEAFRAYARAFPESSVFLVDTCGVEEGVKNAISVAKEMERQGQKLKGIRIDSGDLAAHSKLARKLLDAAGLPYVKIMLSGDLDEYKIAKLREEGAKFDSAGVGKSISTCDDSPHIDMIYKLCEHEISGKKLPASKKTFGKETYGGMKQIYRFKSRKGAFVKDEVCLFSEKRKGAEALLEKMMEKGKIIPKLPSLSEKRKRIAAQKASLLPSLRSLLPCNYGVEYSRLVTGIRLEEEGSIEKTYSLLVSGLSDYLKKSGFSTCVLGLSGGVDSALSACIASDAVGARNVICAFMPSNFTPEKSREDAMKVAKNIGARFIEIPISAEYSSFVATLAPHMKSGHRFSVVEENIQARLRANMLYALSNEHGWFVLNTSNKSEAAVGYGTLYGDMAGGYGVIADVPKTLVYGLCNHVNKKAGFGKIPKSVLGKPPSAELRSGQKDSDSLPPYKTLDRIIELYFERKMPKEEIVRVLSSERIGAGTVRETIAKFLNSAHKRRQSPPCTKISQHGLDG